MNFRLGHGFNSSHLSLPEATGQSIGAYEQYPPGVGSDGSVEEFDLRIVTSRCALITKYFHDYRSKHTDDVCLSTVRVNICIYPQMSKRKCISNYKREYISHYLFTNALVGSGPKRDEKLMIGSCRMHDGKIITLGFEFHPQLPSSGSSPKMCKASANGLYSLDNGSLYIHKLLSTYEVRTIVPRLIRVCFELVFLIHPRIYELYIDGCIIDVCNIHEVLIHALDV